MKKVVLPAHDLSSFPSFNAGVGKFRPTRAAIASAKPMTAMAKTTVTGDFSPQKMSSMK